MGAAYQIIACTLWWWGREPAVLLWVFSMSFSEVFLLGSLISIEKDLPVVCLGRICLAVSTAGVKPLRRAGFPRLPVRLPVNSPLLVQCLSPLSCLQTLDLAFSRDSPSSFSTRGSESGILQGEGEALRDQLPIISGWSPWFQSHHLPIFLAGVSNFWASQVFWATNHLESHQPALCKPLGCIFSCSMKSASIPFSKTLLISLFCCFLLIALSVLLAL